MHTECAGDETEHSDDDHGGHAGDDSGDEKSALTWTGANMS